ncbi:hypothetical protein GCM10010307_71160 [Streptomyces vastus]|uniref:Uncharacterized protein n=1 Tax=Streptomyces vastus TaxID=285451 RepID=A0ABN3RNQ0_9ACTN
MKGYVSSDMEGAADEVGHTRAREHEPTQEYAWRDLEILKALMGADVDLDAGFLERTCVEGESCWPDNQSQ